MTVEIAHLKQSQDIAASTEVFQHEWQVYQRAVELDLLCHRDMYAAFAQCLRDHCLGRTIAMLDLGCGDATQPSQVLRQLIDAGLQLASYTGVDVSPAALALAAQQLACLQQQQQLLSGDAGQPSSTCTVSLQQADMKEWLERCAPEQYDVVLQSYSLHHLTQEGKQHFFRLAAHCLKPGGLWFLVDIYKPEGDADDSTDQYNARATAHALAADMTQHQKETVIAHMTHFDLPEKVSTYRAMAAAAGFSSVDCLVQRCDMFCALLLVK